MRTTTVFTATARESAWDEDGNAVEYTVGPEWEPHPSDEEEADIVADEPVHKTGIGWPDWAENGYLRRSADGTVYAACCRTVSRRDLAKVADAALEFLRAFERTAPVRIACGALTDEAIALEQALADVGLIK